MPRRILRRTAAAAAVILAVLLTAFSTPAAATPAASTPSNVRAVTGGHAPSAARATLAVQVFGIHTAGGLYWNAWGGGPNVRLDTAGTNEEFYEQRVYMCGGRDIVTQTCPNYAAADRDLAGAIIIQVVFAPTGQCVGSTSSGTAILTACNSTANGKYGGIGTLQELWQTPGCGGGYGYDYNRNAIDTDRQLRAVESGGYAGGPLVMDGQTPTCWGGQL